MIHRYAFTGLLFGLALFSTHVEGQTQATAPMPALVRSAHQTGKHADRPFHAAALRGSAPVNDDCSGAILLTVNSSCLPTTGDVAGATQSIAALDCNLTTGDADDDVWYKFVATNADQIVEVTGSANFDVVLDLRSGACSGTNIACADATFDGGTEQIAASGLTVGATYYVRLYDWYTGAAPTTTFDICVYENGAVPPNDLCSSVTPQLLSAGGALTFTGTSFNAQNTEGYAWASAWEAFTTTQCMNVTWDFCGSLDNMLIITGAISGCPYAAVANACNTPEITCPDGIQLSYQPSLYDLPAGTYYILIPYVPGTWGGQYTINMTGTACSTPTPANNECAGAVALTPALTCVNTIGNTAGATRSLPNLACGAFTGQADDDVWYSFTAVSPGGSIIVTPQDSLDPVIQLYSGTCAGLSALNCADDGVGGDTEELVYSGLAIGTTYYFRVHSYDLGTYCDGFFNVCVTYDPSTSINALAATEWNVFPNPTNGDLTVIYNGATDNMRIDLFDLTGRAVYTEHARLVSGSTLTIGMAGRLAQGTYTMRLSGAQGSTEQRVVVQ